MTHTVVIEDHYDRYTFAGDSRFAVYAKPGNAAGQFWKNGFSDLFVTATLEDAAFRIACTFGVENIKIILV